jgi:two-component system, cell cycle sensor histidine kinase and response regulator CckA
VRSPSLFFLEAGVGNRSDGFQQSRSQALAPAPKNCWPSKRSERHGRALRPSTSSGIVLLVEDDEGLRGLFARGLTSRGFTVVEASNGMEALQIINDRCGQIEIVISDVVMPKMDRVTLLKEMRKKYPVLKMIFISGHGEASFDTNLPENEEFACLPKPCTLKQLVYAIKLTLHT